METTYIIGLLALGLCLATAACDSYIYGPILGVKCKVAMRITCRALRP